MLKLKNSYSQLPERFFQRILPQEFKNPSLIKFNDDLAASLGIDLGRIDQKEMDLLFSGQKLFESSDPIALAYAGHQFGHFVPELGDGRAHLLGDINGFDIQLKGSGPTKFSRRGDGLSALGPVIREYIVSEAMYHLGVPTTRALAAVRTGDSIMRESLVPGGIFTRVAPGHIRVGTFQYFQARQDLEALALLLEYSINKYYPEINKLNDQSDKALEFIASVCEAQSTLVANWISLGFIHGVMNTDNFTIGGFTLDFGPCAFVDEYKHDKVFSSIDRNGRYSFENQTEIAQWNILRLAEALLPLIDAKQEIAIKKVQSILQPLLSNFEKKKWIQLSKKLGIKNFKTSDVVLIETFLNYLEEKQLDFTMSFRNLSELHQGDYSSYEKTSELIAFVEKWKERVINVDELNHINPLYIPRNHQVESAIQNAYNGDYKKFDEMVEVSKNPFRVNLELNKYSLPPKASERVQKTFCGT